MSDPLSEILQLVEARTFVSGRLTAGGDWSVRFPPPEKIKFTALLTGGCWLELEHRPEPVWLAAGDVIAVNGRLAFNLTSSPGRTPVESRLLFRADGVAQAGDGAEVSLIGGHVAVERRRGEVLMDVLPPLIHVKGESAGATRLRWLLDGLATEAASSQPGAGLAASHLAQLMFLELLRAHLMQGAPGEARGWLAALGDARLAPALALIHGDASQPLSLAALAAASALSRTAFAVRFRAVTGRAPMSYLADWRLRVAERALKDSAEPVASIARSVGYASESAFTHAFRRANGMSPRTYRQATDAAPTAGP